MFRRSKNLILTRPFVAAILGVTVTAEALAELLTGATCHLFKEGNLPSPDRTVPADYTECAFTGYANEGLSTWVGPSNVGNTGLLFHDEVNYEAGTPFLTDSEAALGYFVVVGGVVQFAEEFEEPVGFAAANDRLSLDVCLQLGFYQTVTA